MHFGSHHEQSLAKWLQDNALRHNADVICTQEDSVGLLMDSYPEAGFACNHTTETVRVYVRRSLFGGCTFQPHIDPPPQLPPNCQYFPGRCALTVQLPSGVRVTNIFLHGGRFVDRNFALPWCSSALRDLRRSFVQSIINDAQPDIFAGDWNSDPDAAVEETLYNRRSDYAKRLGMSTEQ